jgi:predicted transcriptional regulator
VPLKAKPAQRRAKFARMTIADLLGVSQATISLDLRKLRTRL